MNQNSAHLFVIPWGLEHLGGVNQVVINLARQAKFLAVHEPIIFICDWDSPVPVFGEYHGIKTIRWRARPWSVTMSLKEKFVYWFWAQRFVPLFERFCIEYNIALINPHYPTDVSLSLGRVIKRMRIKPKFLLSFHGSDIENLRNGSESIRDSWRRGILESSGVVACSANLSMVIRKTLGEEINPVVIHNGIDLNFFIRRGVVKSIDRRIILSVGKFDRIKGQDILIKAFSLLCEIYDDVDLCIVGGSGPALGELHDLSVKERVDGRVLFFKDVAHSEMPRFFMEATIFVLPSRREAFGLVLLEAGAMGLPVVATRVGGVPELIVDGVTGCLVMPDDPDDLADQIKRILDDKVLAERLGSNLKARVSGDFTWKVAYDKYARLSV